MLVFVATAFILLWYWQFGTFHLIDSSDLYEVGNQSIVGYVIAFVWNVSARSSSYGSTRSIWWMCTQIPVIPVAWLIRRKLGALAEKIYDAI